MAYNLFLARVVCRMFVCRNKLGQVSVNPPRLVLCALKWAWNMYGLAPIEGHLWGLQGVPYNCLHFDFVIFSGSRSHTEKLLTIFQQLRRWGFQNSPYFTSYMKKRSSYSTKREINWILKVSFWWQILLLCRGVANFRVHYLSHF